MKIRCSWLPISQMCILEGASGQQGHMDRDTKVTPDLWISTQVLPPDTVSPRAGKETREGKMQAPATTGVLGPSPPIVTLEGNTAHGGDQSSFPRVQLRNSRADKQPWTWALPTQLPSSEDVLHLDGSSRGNVLYTGADHSIPRDRGTGSG